MAACELKAFSDKVVSNLGCFHEEDKESILCWLERLNKPPRDDEESETILEYAKFLNHVTNNGRIHYPFTESPPCKRLPPLQEYFRKCKEPFPGCPTGGQQVQQGACSPQLAMGAGAPSFTQQPPWQLMPQSPHSPPSPASLMQPWSPAGPCPPASPMACPRSGFMEMSQVSVAAVPQGWMPAAPRPPPAPYCPPQAPPCPPPTPPCPVPIQPPCPAPVRPRCSQRASGGPSVRFSGGRRDPFMSLNETKNEATPDYLDDDGPERFAHLKHMSVGDLLEEYDKIDSTAKRDAILVILHNLLEWAEFSPPAASTPMPSKNRACANVTPEEGPSHLTIDEFKDMPPEELIEIFKRELNAEPNPYLSLRLYYMAEMVSKILSKLKGKEMKVWPFHEIVQVNQKAEHLKNMSIDDMFNEMRKGEKNQSVRHVLIGKILKSLFWVGTDPFIPPLDWKPNKKHFHLSVDRPDRVRFEDIFDLTYRTLKTEFQKEMQLANYPHTSMRLQIMALLVGKYERLKKNPRYPHLRDLTVAGLLNEFGKGEHERTYRDEAIVQLLKDIFWKKGGMDTAKNPRGFTLPQDKRFMPTLDDILKMNVEQLQDQLDQEINFIANPSTNVRIVMMLLLLTKAKTLQNLAKKTGQPIAKCPEGQGGS